MINTSQRCIVYTSTCFYTENTQKGKAFTVVAGSVLWTLSLTKNTSVCAAFNLCSLFPFSSYSVKCFRTETTRYPVHERADRTCHPTSSRSLGCGRHTFTIVPSHDPPVTAQLNKLTESLKLRQVGNRFHAAWPFILAKKKLEDNKQLNRIIC